MWDVGSELYVITCSEFCVYQVDPLVLWQKYGTFDALEVHVSMTIWVVTTTCLVWVMYWVLMHRNPNFGTLWDLWRGGHKFVLTQYNCCLLGNWITHASALSALCVCCENTRYRVLQRLLRVIDCLKHYPPPLPTTTTTIEHQQHYIIQWRSISSPSVRGLSIVAVCAG